MNRFSEIVEKEIAHRYIGGESTIVLAKIYEVSVGGIRGILARQGINCRLPGERPIRSDAGIHQMDTEQLIQMVEQGMSIREIARAMNVSPSIVSNTCKYLNIPLKDRMEQSLAKRCRTIPENLFVPRLDSNASWLLGILMTDGNVSDQGRITLSTSDEDGAQKAKEIIGFGEIRRQVPRGNTSVLMHCYEAHSRHLATRLENFGIMPRKTKVMGFPNPSNLVLPDFVRGLWDGDGSWHIDRRDGSLIASFGCASEPFIHALRSVTADITGSMANIRKHGQKEFWYLSYQGRSARNLARWLYYDVSVYCLHRKHTLVTSFL
jgi:Helix-turn-helix domain of resolvase/LAGLIDADG-like domain